MKKIMAFFVLGLSVVMAGNAMAKKHGGGFEGPGVNSAVSVQDALKMSDDSHVVLKGKIEKSLGNEKYQFNDGTGIIIIEIDDDEWNGVVVKPENTVEIRGEIDKELMSQPQVDVEMIMLAQ